MEWWIWILLGLALLLGELLTPGGFYIIFFGIGAIVVGTLAGLGIAGPAWFQVIIFCVASVVTLGLFRGRLLQLTQVESRDDVDSLVGETAVMMEEVPVKSVGKAEMRGTAWNACNIGERTLSLGERCKVERVEGLTIFVRAEQN